MAGMLGLVAAGRGGVVPDVRGRLGFSSIGKSLSRKKSNMVEARVGERERMRWVRGWL
jgi:hypothetical protein